MPKTFTILEAEGLYGDSEEYEAALRILQGPEHAQVTLLRAHPEQLSMADLVPFGQLKLSEEQRSSVDAILTLKLWVTKEDLAIFPNLKVVVRMGVGVDILDR